MLLIDDCSAGGSRDNDSPIRQPRADLATESLTIHSLSLNIRDRIGIVAESRDKKFMDARRP